MITPQHRAAIGRQAQNASVWAYPLTMLQCVINSWVLHGYDKNEVTKLVEDTYQETTNADSQI